MHGRMGAALGVLGPGLAVAATGVGAGDIVAAAVSGAEFGVAVAWAALVGAVLKLALNEGIARWQLATGATLLEGWARHLHRSVLVGFVAYLVLWTVIVAGALMAACGLAAHAVLPGLSVAQWGALHALAALALVYFGRYALFERLMKLFIAVMFVTVLGAALRAAPPWAEVARGLVLPAVPAGAGPFLLGIVGGVGGSVTLLSYSYWIRERGWAGPGRIQTVRLDLGAAYALTGVFGVAVIVIAAGVGAERMAGNEMALSLARRVGAVAGPATEAVFLAGFWGAVFTSMLGVWQGVPYLFADALRLLRGKPEVPGPESRAYRAYLLFIALPPMLLLLVDRPVWIVLLYSAAGALFMPFLAATLLYLNNRRVLLKHLQNRLVANVALAAALVLFAFLAGSELVERL